MCLSQLQRHSLEWEPQSKATPKSTKPSVVVWGEGHISCHVSRSAEALPAGPSAKEQGAVRESQSVLWGHH